MLNRSLLVPSSRSNWVKSLLIAAIVAMSLAGLQGITRPEAAAAKAPAAAVISSLSAGAAETDIDAFWMATLTAAGYAYYTPALLGFSEPITTGGCGAVDPWNYTSFYCQVDSTVYYSIPSVAGEYERFGDAGWIHMIAHEWGHHVQLLTGILANVSDVMTLELQATCLAGVYVQDAATRSLISPDAVIIMQDMFSGDATHGSRDALRASFDAGYSGNLAGCGVFL